MPNPFDDVIANFRWVASALPYLGGVVLAVVIGIVYLRERALQD